MSQSVCCRIFLTTHDSQPFTSDIPRGDIYEMISPDILHQLIKGTFKDHLVTWICEYFHIWYGEHQASIILDDIQWVKKLSQYLAISERVVCNKSNKLHKNMKIIYVIV